MDGSRRSSSSVNLSTVAQPAPSGFQKSNRYEKEMICEEIKENDQQFNRGAAMRTTDLKKEHKNFVSTTKSAASKKNILTEKNEAPSSECSGTYSAKNPEINRSGLVYEQHDAAPHVASFPVTTLHRSGEETVVGSESQPYDPLTNYLSPRPKFLRYDPNRRREIYLRRERGLKEAEGSSGCDPRLSFEAGGSSSEGDTSDSPAASPSLKQESSDVKSLQDKETHENLDEEEVDDSEEEEEEEDVEQTPSCFNLVWKSLLLFWILFFSTCYISWVHPQSTVSSLQSSCFSKECLFTTQNSLQEVAENVGTSLNNYVGTYMNACSHGHFNELKNWGNGIGSNRLDGLLKPEDFEGGKLKGEGEAKSEWADNVKSNTHMVMVDGKFDDIQVLQDESKTMIEEGSDSVINSISIMAEGEIEGEAEKHLNVEAEDVYLTEGENKGSLTTDLEHEDGFGGAVMFGDHEEDIIMESEIGETSDVTEKNSKPVQSILEEHVSDSEEEGPPLSFEQGMNFENKGEKEYTSVLQNATYPSPVPGSMEDADALRFYRIKVLTTVLMVLTVAAYTIIGFLHFWKTSPPDNKSSASLSTSGFSAEGRSCSQLAKMGKTGDEGFNVPVCTDRCKELCEGHPPSLELPEERFAGSFVNTYKCTELYETNPPRVKLLGEFRVSEQEISKTEDVHLRRKNTRMEERQSLSQEETMRKKRLPSAEGDNHLPSDFLSAESSAYTTPGEEKSQRKQNNGHGPETAKVASTPVRRSSRIRNRVASPGA